MPLKFEWDESKTAANLVKHRVGFTDATTVFADNLSLTIPDPAHSQEEVRLITVGRNHRGKLLVVVHTERSDSTSIISARPAIRKEREKYEENI